METLEGKMTQVEASGNTIINGYAIPDSWVDLITGEITAADVLALVVSYGGYIHSEGMDIATNARQNYDRQIADEAKYGETAWALTGARYLVERNRMLREHEREVPFDERFKWPTSQTA